MTLTEGLQTPLDIGMLLWKARRKISLVDKQARERDRLKLD